MNSLKRVLAATDLCAAARHAVVMAFVIAGATGAGLTLLHVLSRGRLEQLRGLLGTASAAVDRGVCHLKGMRPRISNSSGGSRSQVRVTSQIGAPAGEVMPPRAKGAAWTKLDWVCPPCPGAPRLSR